MCFHCSCPGLLDQIPGLRDPQPGCLTMGGRPLNRCGVTATRRAYYNLKPRDQARVDTDNAACAWVLRREWARWIA